VVCSDKPDQNTEPINITELSSYPSETKDCDNLKETKDCDKETKDVGVRPYDPYVLHSRTWKSAGSRT
jgi:hypothetical protein